MRYPNLRAADTATPIVPPSLPQAVTISVGSARHVFGSLRDAFEALARMYADEVRSIRASEPADDAGEEAAS